jgi:para-aminobenzoate synthetase / 4-amino-4-deoxychorismate lyase
METAGRASFGVGAAEDAWRATLETPVDLREARRLEDVFAVVAWADACAQQGRWVVLLLAYDAAPAFDPALAVPDWRAGRGAASSPVPLAWAACYDDARRPDPVPATRAPDDLEPVAWRPSIDQAQFTADITRVLAHITAGDTYQVNYTFPLTAPFPHDPWAWFQARARQARVPFAACIDLGAAVVLSLSPELFVERRGSRLSARPMKGTVRRGRWLAEDQRLATALVASEKARAENVMIVDLLRNDIGRVAQTGSVRVSDLCALERYPTVWQLTSRIDATALPATTLWDVLRAVFPCGSVTGAPKVRTMGIIADLESSPRGIYTGAICLLEPGGDFTASVPIRTAVVDRATGTATFHVGAGITADSTAMDEWAECLAKARVARPPAIPDDAALLETLRLEDGLLVRRQGHVARALGSADLFGWDVSPEAIAAALDRLAAQHPTGLWRARLRVERTGVVDVSAVPFEPDARPWQVDLAAEPVDTRNALLFNKTTERRLYEHARGAAPMADDVLLWNARGELTESTVANLVVELEGRKVTPPVSCGLLPGVLRGDLVARGEVLERVVRVTDLAQVTRLWLVNSLRGWIDVHRPPGGWGAVVE